MKNALLEQTVRLVRKIVAPLQRRVQLMVSRGVVNLVDDTQDAQTLQVEMRADQLRDDVERFQEYGFTSHPEPGSESVVVLVGGSADHGIVVATEDRRYRPKTLAEGEVALYTKFDGIRVHLLTDGMVLLGTEPTDFVALAAPTKSEISALRDTVNALVTTFNSHIHTTTATVGAGATPGIISAPTSSASAPAAVGDVKATEVKAK